MAIMKKIKNLVREYHPFSASMMRRMRRDIQNREASFLCPNCIGGHLFHDMGLQFRSPTVNLMLFQPDFVKFVRDLDGYLDQELKFFRHPEHEFPCAKLGDITIHFTHYHTEEEAAQKWHQRAQRLDRENLFVFLTERDGLSWEEILSLKDLNVRGLVVFTANSYPDIPYVLQIPKYEADGQVGNILAMSALDGKREYERYFDFVKWFNEAGNDPSYNVAPYARKG